LAWLAPIAIAFGGVALTIALSEHDYVGPGQAAIAILEATAPQTVEQVRALPALDIIIIAQALLLGAIINTVVLTFSE
jgi:hypothetical protein